VSRERREFTVDSAQLTVSEEEKIRRRDAEDAEIRRGRKEEGSRRVHRGHRERREENPRVQAAVSVPQAAEE